MNQNKSILIQNLYWNLLNKLFQIKNRIQGIMITAMILNFQINNLKTSI